MKIKWDLDGFEALRRAPGVAADVDARAYRVAQAAGPGHVPSPYEGLRRHRASVITTTYEARRKSARENHLLRSLDAGR